MNDGREEEEFWVKKRGRESIWNEKKRMLDRKEGGKKGARKVVENTVQCCCHR